MLRYLDDTKRQPEAYGINRIRAMLIETLDTKWTEVLRHAAKHPLVAARKRLGCFGLPLLSSLPSRLL